MVRTSAQRPARRWMRFGGAAVPWVAAACLAQGAVGAELGRIGRELEQHIEMQLKGGAPRPPPEQPQRTHEDSIEPWELVGV
jgi:hypothetical protein